ncbi:hypothetical protein [Frankia sp. AgKG'84/4]|uniref:hypothetical protein n=1 Tax=Frankia sp. AgKG'84/4 TaxID=573490 RepID=UPI00200BDB17|nr:hypothetical protein [Frankia sp. AgKG'84/4]MCL9795254.1 hypothetical protein [Frankia sp. AgKG'84/4]
MIESATAFSLATEYLGRPRDDAEKPWRLVEFPEGWLVRQDLPGRGGAAVVIERSSGKIKRFPSYVPPVLICDDYASVVNEGDEVPVAGGPS